MEEEPAILALYVVANLFPFLFHVFGLFLLLQIKELEMNGSQRIFLIHLSLSELLLAAFGLARDITKGFKSKMDTHVYHVANILQLSGISFVYYAVMILLTTDRFFELYLNIKYPLYWSSRQTKRVMLVTWLLAAMFTVTVIVVHYVYKFDYRKMFYTYFYPIIETIFLIVAGTTYTYVFRVYRKGNKKIANLAKCSNDINTGNDRTGRRKSVRVNITHSTFYLPTLLILSFILLIVLPDFIHFFAFQLGATLHEAIEHSIYITYQLAFTLDAVFYIFLCPPVRRLMIKLFCKKRHYKRRNAVFERRNAVVELQTSSAASTITR